MWSGRVRVLLLAATRYLRTPGKGENVLHFTTHKSGRADKDFRCGDIAIQQGVVPAKLTELHRKTKREEEADLMAAKARDIRFEMEFVVRAGSPR